MLIVWLRTGSQHCMGTHLSQSCCPGSVVGERGVNTPGSTSNTSILQQTVLHSVHVISFMWTWLAFEADNCKIASWIHSYAHIGKQSNKLHNRNYQRWHHVYAGHTCSTSNHYPMHTHICLKCCTKYWIYQHTYSSQDPATGLFYSIYTSIYNMGVTYYTVIDANRVITRSRYQGN